MIFSIEIIAIFTPMICWRKIAFVPILLAWSIIMVHNIVPHHHHAHNLAHCHACEQEHMYAPALGTVSIHQQHTDKHFICHFHVDALSHLTLDIHFLPPTTNELLPQEITVTYGVPVDRPLKIKALYLTNHQLRAPPVA